MPSRWIINREILRYLDTLELFAEICRPVYFEQVLELHALVHV